MPLTLMIIVRSVSAERVAHRSLVHSLNRASIPKFTRFKVTRSYYPVNNGDVSTVRDHLPPDAQAYLMRHPQWCLAQAKSIGPACLAIVESLFSHRVLDHLRAAQGVIRLSDNYGRRRLEAACARALNFGAPQYRTVKQILSQGLDQQPDLIETFELEAPYRGGGRFSRNPSLH